MIHYDLACGQGHRFEAWFRSSQDFDSQAAQRLLNCPTCGSAEVAKALMAPALSRGAAEAMPVPPAAAPPELALVAGEHARLRTMMAELRAELTKNSMDVGDRFAEEARKIHYGEVERATIHGRATPQEARDLAEEGVAFHPLPALPDEHN
jgi:hypothetical protein